MKNLGKIDVLDRLGLQVDPIMNCSHVQAFLSTIEAST